MITRQFLAAVALGAAGAAFPVMAQDADAPTNVDVAGTGGPGATARLVLAADLHAVGLAQKDPLTILTAARLAMGVSTREVARDREGDVPLQPAPPPTEGVVDTATMLSDATALAGEDEVLLTLIERTGAEAIALGGPQGQVAPVAVTHATLTPGAAETWRIPFYGGSYAEVAILAVPSTALRMAVSDAEGARICADAGASARGYCGFVPAENGYFLVTVSNPGSGDAAYDLLTN